MRADRERESVKVRERRKEREVEYKVKGGQKEGAQKKQVYLLLALQADQVSVAPR